ncbi:MAG: M48 family metallopeptidase [Collinsella stercoris]|nr:M48 family metallopeptidase [Collinsella stercoris]
MNAAPFILTLNIDGLEIPVEVTRKRVKNLNLRVRSDGTVTLSIPLRTPHAYAQAFLDRKAAWIAERVRRSAEQEALKTPDGEAPGYIPLWGAPVPREAALGEHIGIDDLYRAEVTRVLPDVAARIEQIIGVHAARWRVRTMKTRWGSCTPKTGAIRINARLAAYPPECLEFVVAHELVHLLEPSHNARFHALLDEFCPNNRSIAQRLKQNPVLA